MVINLRVMNVSLMVQISNGVRVWRNEMLLVTEEVLGRGWDVRDLNNREERKFRVEKS